MAFSTPTRTCIACRQTSIQSNLIRFVLPRQGELRIDMTGLGQGRGAYLCSKAACLDKLIQNPRLVRHFLRVPALTRDLIIQLRTVCTN